MKSLIQTNPYLKDPVKREELVTRSVNTSGAVEGIEFELSSGNVFKDLNLPNPENELKQEEAAFRDKYENH